MSQASVKEFLATAKQDEAIRQQLKSAMTIHGCIEVAQDKGYNFTAEELQSELNEMSEEDVAEIVNPGVSPRRHLEPR